eukprot:COSAG05_NODE_2204_length_3399_cov_4.885593_5_plen_72_part_00
MDGKRTYSRPVCRYTAKATKNLRGVAAVRIRSTAVPSDVAMQVRSPFPYLTWMLHAISMGHPSVLITAMWR